MAKRVLFTEQARADIRAIEQQTALQILKTIARFLESGEGNIKRLQGIEPPLLRLRAQNHRVFFRDLGEILSASYDPAGNQTQNGSLSLSYDAEGRLRHG